MKFKSLMVVVIATLLMLASGCATNQYDAQIAASEASVQVAKEKYYAESIAASSAPKLLVKMQGEFRCSVEQILEGNCGMSVYNPNVKSTIPTRETNGFDAIDMAGGRLIGVLDALTPWALMHEAGNMVNDAGKNAGGNISNNNSGNTHTERNITKSSGGDLLDNGSNKDMSRRTSTSYTTNTRETVRGNKVINGSLDNSTYEVDRSVEDSYNGRRYNSNISTVTP